MQTTQKRVLAAILMTASVSAWALDTDDSGTIGKSGWELETTLEFSQDKESGQTAKERALGLSLNYGLSDVLDIGIAFGHAHNDDGTTSISGLGDTEVGLKWRFYEQDGLSFAVSPVLVLPSGDDEKGLGTGKVSFGANLIASKELDKGWSLHANAGWGHVNFKDQALADASNRDLWHTSVAVQKELAEQWAVGAELGLACAEEKGGDENPAFGAIELVYTPSEKMEFSAGYKFGLNDVETDAVVGLGATFSW